MFYTGRPGKTMGKTVKIETREMLRGLYKKKAGKNIYISLPDYLEPSKRKRWEIDINKYYSECGCGVGTIGIKMGFIAAVITESIYVLFKGVNLTVMALLLFAFVIAGAVAGKILGVTMARKELKTTISEIEKQFSNKTNF